MDVTGISILTNTRKFMQFHNFWPRNNFDKGFYSKIFLVKFFSSFFEFGLVGHLVALIKDGRTSDMDQHIMIVLSYICIWFYNGIHVAKKHRIAEVYKEMSDFSIFGKPSNFDEMNKKLDKISLIHYIYLIFIVNSSHVTIYLAYNRCQKINLEKNVTDVCGMTSIWVPFDIDYFPVRELFWIMEVYSANQLYIPFALAVFAMWESIEHLTLHVTHLRNMIVHCIEDETDPRERRRLFGKAVRYHNRLLSYAETLNSCYKNSNFTFIILHGLAMGINLYQILQNPKVYGIFYMTGMTGTLLIICYSGEQLVNICVEIGTTVYNSKWYNLDVSLQKDLVVFIQRSQQPVLLQAGAFGTFNYELMIKILKTIYSVLTIRKTLEDMNR